MKKIMFFILLLSLNLKIFSQSLDFCREIINIEVHPDSSVLIGEYFFCKESNINTQILYPFAINDSLSFPDSIAIFDEDGKKIKSHNRKEAAVFQLKSNYFKAYYSQKTKKNYFEYILVTTATWGKPLDEAWYNIKIHNSLKLIGLSVPYNNVEKAGNFIIYHAYRKDYMPKKNIVIEWE